MLRLLKLALAVCAVTFSDASEKASAATPHSSIVPTLKSGDFDEFIKTNPTALVKFMAPWCGHCKKLAPEYEAAAAVLKKKSSIPLAEVDATQEAELAKKYGVQGFPTIFLFRNGKPENYTGGRTKDAIVDWVNKMTGPAVTYVKSKEAAAKVEGGIVFVGAFKSKDSKEATMFETVANSNRMKGAFVAYIDSSLAEGTVTVLRTGEDPVTSKVSSTEALTTFINDEAVPLLGPVNGDNYGTYTQRSPNWVWFAANSEDYQSLGNGIRKVSKNYRSQFNFVWLDIDVLKAHAENGLGLKEFPAIAVVHEDAKYLLTGKLTEKELTKFIENVKAGKVKRFLKSEPVPEKNDELVKTVVGSQFSEIVLQKDKDVFLKIYAPWCGHCKKIAPVWEELAEQLKDNQHIVIAKFDGTANEPDTTGFDFHGFPTLYYVKAGTNAPIPYDGDRTVEGMISFIKKHASKPITVPDFDKEDESKDEL